MTRNRLIGLFVMSIIFLLSPALPTYGQTTITISPQSPESTVNCLPFGLGGNGGDLTWLPYMGFVYQNIPAFDLRPGNVLAFDLIHQNNTDIQLEIAMARTTTNGGDQNAGPFTTIVHNTQPPLNPRGDTIVGNYELQFTVEAPFSFPGGGLIIRFSNPSASYALDTICSGVLGGAASSDASGNFVERFFTDSDGVFPWSNKAGHQIAGFRIIMPATWTGNVSIPFQATSLSEDSSGNIKFQKSSTSFTGTMEMYIADMGPQRSIEGCYAKLAGVDGSKICITQIANISTDVQKSRTDQVLLTGTGTMSMAFGGTLHSGIAYLDVKGTLKKDSSGKANAVSLSGKIGGGADEVFVVTGNLKTTLTE